MVEGCLEVCVCYQEARAVSVYLELPQLRDITLPHACQLPLWRL